MLSVGDKRRDEFGNVWTVTVVTDDMVGFRRAPGDGSIETMPLPRDLAEQITEEVNDA